MLTVEEGLAVILCGNSSSPISLVVETVSLSGVERLVSELFAREGDAERLEQDILAVLGSQKPVVKYSTAAPSVLNDLIIITWAHFAVTCKASVYACAI